MKRCVKVWLLFFVLVVLVTHILFLVSFNPSWLGFIVGVFAMLFSDWIVGDDR